ncbi:MAG: helix-turn-helix domain-containing protein [Clostridia bacterium]|nr:helix-turn-helix domain-containing protein [Clostridia bacterium]
MRPVNDKLAADILEAGKREFLEKGFQGASMRGIAASLGVTTGAIYRYYLDKEAIFDALVGPAAGELEQRYRQVQQAFAMKPVEQQLTSLPEVSKVDQAWMMHYIYEHFDAFKLIASCSVGTRYEHYIDVLVEIEDNAGRVLIDKMTEAGMELQPIDDDLIHIMSNALFQGIFETVRHDMPREKAYIYMERLKDFYSAGWFKILGISGD